MQMRGSGFRAKVFGFQGYRSGVYAYGPNLDLTVYGLELGEGGLELEANFFGTVYKS